jgi:hypothetical protein
MATIPCPTKNTESLSGKIIDRAVMQSTSGGRNKACFDMVCQLRDNGFTQTEAESAAEIYASSVGDRTFTRREAISAVRSAYRRPPREAWSSSVNSSRSPRPQLVRARSIARFRHEEFERFMAEARDKARLERIVRRRALELVKVFDFTSPDWDVIDHFCMADKEADKLLAVADWVQTQATANEIEAYGLGVSR